MSTSTSTSTRCALVLLVRWVVGLACLSGSRSRDLCDIGDGLNHTSGHPCTLLAAGPDPRQRYDSGPGDTKEKKKKGVGWRRGRMYISCFPPTPHGCERERERE
ncbi:hypothetical protein EV126DRAFT_428079 [Verticillium dahliae]|nr:hypothetical protein EV126DRAFT_428079 [Verticillium dahliae]